jgi:hypothetical protein
MSKRQATPTPMPPTYDTGRRRIRQDRIWRVTSKARRIRYCVVAQHASM